MFSWYVLNVKPYIQLLQCVYGIYFAAKYIFQRLIKSQRGFSNADAGAGYTFYPHSFGISRTAYLLFCQLVNPCISLSTMNCITTEHICTL